jgi:hypothetical protein
MTVAIDELITGIRRTREGMSLSMLRDGEAVYRRLLPRHQDAWDALAIPEHWLSAELRLLRHRIESANRTQK